MSIQAAYPGLGKPEPDIYRARPAEGGFGIWIGPRPEETAMSLSMRMRDFSERYGMMASPEWFGEDIAKGTF